jgi:hypothetical protein
VAHLVSHEVGDEAQVAGVHTDAIRAEHGGHLAQDGGTRSLGSTGKATRPDVNRLYEYMKQGRGPWVASKIPRFKLAETTAVPVMRSDIAGERAARQAGRQAGRQVGSPQHHMFSAWLPRHCR